MRRSIGAQFGLVVLLTVAVVGVAGFLAGRSILAQLASLAEDKPVIDALSAGQKALVDLHNVRRLMGELAADACARDLARPCALPSGTPVATERLGAASGAAPSWEGETRLTRDAGAQRVRYTFAWPELKPQFARVTEAIGTREYLNTLLPSVAASFLMIYAGALCAAAALGLLVTYLLGRRLTGRAARLVTYTRKIAAGALEPPPPGTLGQDEVGVLAEAMHSMAKDLEETRQRLVLAEKMQSWQNIARKVAHEIKNPLTPISLVAAELRQRAGKARPGEGEFLGEAGRILAEETASLGRMVQEFTAFARLPAPEPAVGDLLELVRDFASRNAAPGGPELLVEERSAGQAFPVVVDRGMIMQILHNLTNNARLAAAPKRARIVMTLTADERGYALDVADNGPGVPESLKQTLFDAYVTTRSTGDGEKGMGLGLTIARKIASDHGGSLMLFKSGANGAVFRLRLPPGGLGGPPLA